MVTVNNPASPAASQHVNGKIEYRNNIGELHRTDGPALVYSNGRAEWFLEGERHRVDGPAVVYPDGHKAWYLHGERHRFDGPAVIHFDGEKEYWVNGKRTKNSDSLIRKLFNGHGLRR